MTDTKRKVLEAEYRKLAKRADQRLVRLEGYSHDKYFKEIKKFAYAVAAKDINAFFTDAEGNPLKGNPRFNRSLRKPKGEKQLTEQEIYARINAVKKFLNYASSTIEDVRDRKGNVIKKGIKTVYVNRAKTINEKYHLEGDQALTWVDIAELMETGLWDKADSKYGSDSAWVKIGEFKQDKKLEEMLKKGEIIKYTVDGVDKTKLQFKK